jgi:hypothetical protein
VDAAIITVKDGAPHVLLTPVHLPPDTMRGQALPYDHDEIIPVALDRLRASYKA